MNNNKQSNSSSSSSEDDDFSEDETDHVPLGRPKRQIAWCGVDTETASASSSTVSWPPQPIHVNNHTWRQLKPTRIGGNPIHHAFGTKMQLFSKTNHFLAVYPDGKVRGTLDASDLHTHLELINAGHPGHLRIKGLLTNLYVAMKPKGRIYAEPNVNQDNTIFIESIRGFYNVYLNQQYAFKGWYLGIKKNGKMKNGKQTQQKQKAVQFLPKRK